MFSKMQNFAAFFRFARLNEQNILFKGQKLPYPRSFKILSRPHFLTDFDEILTVTPSDGLLKMHKAPIAQNQNCGVHRCKCSSEAKFCNFFCHSGFYSWLHVSAIKTNKLSRQDHQMYVGECWTKSLFICHNEFTELVMKTICFHGIEKNCHIWAFVFEVFSPFYFINMAQKIFF